MSNSYLHTPIKGIAGSSGAQGKFKKQEHSRERAAVRDRLIKEQWEQMPHPKKYGNEWGSPRDGKSWFGNCKYKKPGKYRNWPEEWMRK